MSLFPYQTNYDVEFVENGIIVRQTTPEGLDMTLVHVDDENLHRKISRAVERDIFSTLREEEKEQFFTHIRISLTIEDLSEEGGAL